jgi:hypothetical protein
MASCGHAWLREKGGYTSERTCLLYRGRKGELGVWRGEVVAQGGGGKHERHALAQQAQREGVAVLHGWEGCERSGQRAGRGRGMSD